MGTCICDRHKDHESQELQEQIKDYTDMFDVEGYHSLNYSAQKHCAELQQKLAEIDMYAYLTLKIERLRAMFRREGYKSTNYSKQQELSELIKQREALV